MCTYSHTKHTLGVAANSTSLPPDLVCCSERVAVCCSERVAVCCSERVAVCCSERVAVCCSLLRCVALCCTVLQCAVTQSHMTTKSASIGIHLNLIGLQHTAIQCSTVQHNATDCNTTQQTATQRNRLQHIPNLTPNLH